MVTFMPQKADIFKAKVTEAQTLHAREVVIATERSVDGNDRVENSTCEMEAMTQAIDSSLQEFKKGVGANLKQLSS